MVTRSSKKHPFCGNSLTESEKKDKQIANRKDRRLCREVLRSIGDDAGIKQKKETSNRWSMAKDGRQRVDLVALPECVRK